MDLGRYGIWGRTEELDPDLAGDLEELGYGAIWIGGSPPADLALAEQLLDTTTDIVVATGIVNIWSADADEVAASYHRIEAVHPGRFLLGIGVGHPEATSQYTKPYAALVDYLDRLDAAGVPESGRVLAALGPKVLELAARRSAGAHPYLTTPEHTADARTALGPNRLLGPEHKVVLETDPDRARAIGRPAVQNPYLGLVNYTNNLKRYGWTEPELADGGSDRLIDALVLHGSAAEVAEGLSRHLDAGADHVCLQLVTAKGANPRRGYAELATALRLTT